MDWSKKGIAQLKAKLIRRRLARTGMMHNLAQRLKAMDKFPRTPSGRQGVYEKELERYREEALERVVAFEPFSRLPKELREYIWDLSLPGPRVLSMGIAEWEGKEVAYFPKGPSAPNRVLLFVNREAREVALRRYPFVRQPKPQR
jgi:hypothetical protein